MNSELFLDNYKLFWQYPAKTEWAFYQQNKSNSNYIGLPWATFHDKRYNLQVIYKLILPHIDKNKYYYTCCQHIAYKKFIPLWKALNINIVFIPHKQLGLDVIDDIKLLPCPLYAVNIETPEFNSTFDNINIEESEKTLLYSFIGGYQPRDYMTNIREKIFNMKHPENTDIVNTGIWHLNDLVFSKDQNFNGDINKPNDFDYKTSYYNSILLKSKFTLCPSGSGPNSIRFWEALAVGSIPILLSDTLELPFHELWDEAIIRIPEKDVEKINDTICLLEKNMVTKMSKNCIKIYNDFKNNYRFSSKNNKILFTSYICNKDDDIITNIINQWELLNPTFIVKYFSDNDVNLFFQDTEYYNIYKKMKNGVAKADLFRICYIQKYGGYWFDLDLQPTTIIIPKYGNIHLYDVGFKNISYMFIGGNPNQKLFQDTINNVIKNIIRNLNNKKEHVLDITGPRVIQNLIYNKLNIKNIDGAFECKKKNEIILENDEYEFIYNKLICSNFKTNQYQLLQNKYKKLPYQNYNFI